MHITIVDDVYDNLITYKELLGVYFELELIQNPLELLGFLNSAKTDIVLMDLHMPNISGFELYNKLKFTYPELPVIFLTGDHSEESLIKAMKIGADDFVVKPVPLNELVARIKNKINYKKGRTKDTNRITFGSFTLHTDIQMAEIGESKIELTAIEFKIIHLLAKSPNKIFSREYIKDLLWPNIHVENQNIDTHLSNLRKKLQPFSQNIKTLRKRGYILRT